MTVSLSLSLLLYFPHLWLVLQGIFQSRHKLDDATSLLCVCVLCDRYQGFWQFGLCCRFSRLVGRVVNAGVAAVVLLLPLSLPFAAFARFAAVRAVRLLRCLLRLRLFLAETVWYFFLLLLFLFRKLPMRRRST